MRNRRLILSALLFVLGPHLVRAQQPTLSPDRQSAMLKAGQLMNEPAEFALQSRKELALTGAQVAALEKLAAALRDSSVARMALRSREAQTLGSVQGMTSAMEWSGPIDEAAIREATRKQSVMQAEIMIAIARDRRRVGALLTPEQRAQLPQLQSAEMMKAARGGAR